MTARELASRASSFGMKAIERSTTEGADTAVGTTEGVPTDSAGFGKPDPPAC